MIRFEGGNKARSVIFLHLEVAGTGTGCSPSESRLADPIFSLDDTRCNFCQAAKEGPKLCRRSFNNCNDMHNTTIHDSMKQTSAFASNPLGR